VQRADLDVLFEFERDTAARHMAAFTARDGDDRAAFDAHWARLLGDPTKRLRAVLADGELVGSASVYGPPNEREVTYWIARDHWGRGIATAALALLIEEEPARPLRARAAKDNAASLRVLERNGFRVVGEDRGFAAARAAEVEEFVLERP
jgi:RimJ/RimL family protein N-acetyltransferase